ncbi:MAG: hypothetical protein V3W34_05050 [Phycisphaerae bacterium]
MNVAGVLRNGRSEQLVELVEGNSGLSSRFGRGGLRAAHALYGRLRHSGSATPGVGGSARGDGRDGGDGSGGPWFGWRRSGRRLRWWNGGWLRRGGRWRSGRGDWLGSRPQFRGDFLLQPHDVFQRWSIHKAQLNKDVAEILLGCFVGLMAGRLGQLLHRQELARDGHAAEEAWGRIHLMPPMPSVVYT